MTTDQQKAHEQTVLDKAGMERSARCMKRIEQILKEERCVLSISPSVTVAGKAPRIIIVPQERIPRPGV